jgi:hypothetical protein
MVGNTANVIILLIFEIFKQCQKDIKTENCTFRFPTQKIEESSGFSVSDARWSKI